MWPFKTKNDTPETAKPEINPKNAKPKITGQFVFDAEATKKIIEKREPNTISISKMSKNIASMTEDDLSNYLFLKFDGIFQFVQNGDYKLGWMESDAGGKNGGSFLLIFKDEIILFGKMTRPNDGKVAKNGSFILSDWHSEYEYGGVFYAIRSDGVVIVQCKVKANLGNTEISDDGSYAVCQTWNSPISPEDSNKLFFFDLSKPVLVWSCEPESGDADSFRFDVENRILFLENNNGENFRYNFDGTFMDSDKLEKEQIEQQKEYAEKQLALKKAKRENHDLANGYELFEFAIEDIVKIDKSNSDLSRYDEVVLLLKKALEKGVSVNTQASIHRVIGEVYLKQNKVSETIEHYEKALLINPKIGLKKVLLKLKTSNN